MSLDTFLSNVNRIIVNPLILLMFGVALLVFLWGLVQFISNADNEEARSTGRKHLLWGVIGMFIMASAFGIINVILNTFGLDHSAIDSIRKK